MKTPFFILISILGLGLAGCATMRRSASKPTAVAASIEAKPEVKTAQPVTLPSAPEAVYRNPKIGVVYLRAYEDGQGRLFGPQVMYQVTDPGGWNLEAVQQGNGYIPAINVESAPGMGSAYVAPAREIKAPPTNQPLLDPDAAARIVMTGLMRPEDRNQAEAMARQAGVGFAAIFDPAAGWLILPPSEKGASP